MTSSTSPRSRTRRSVLAAGVATLAAAAGFWYAAGPSASPARAADAPAAAAAAPKPNLPGEWPQWRGPNRDGKSPDVKLLQEWPKGGPPLAWKATGLGTGFSGPAVVGDRVYTLGDQKDASYIYCVDAANGKPVWSAKLGPTGNQGAGKDYPGTRGTPAVDGQHVYALGQLGELVCVTAGEGKEVWRKNLVSDFGGTLPDWNYAESVLVDGDRLVCSPGGKQGTMAALDKKTGSVLWRSTKWTDPVHYSSAVIAEFGGRRQYVLQTIQSVAGIDAATGDLLWKSPLKSATAVIPTAVVTPDGYVYCTRGYNQGCDLVKVTADGGAFKAEKVYANNQNMRNKIGNVVLLDGKVYGQSENKGWTCQDLVTGQVVWKDKETSPSGLGAIAYADGRLYLRQDEGKGTVALIEASPDGYKEVGRFDQPNRSGKNSWPLPVIAGGKLYLRDQDVLLCYDVKAK